MHRLLFVLIFGALVWAAVASAAPLSGKLVFEVDHGLSATRVMTANADGSGRSLLGPGFDPSWSPDGERIAFVRLSSSGSRAALHVMDSDGSNVRELSNRSADDPVWSPDGTLIAFESFDEGIIVVPGRGGSAVEIAGDDYINPAWAPDSQWLAFAADKRIVTADRSGRVVRNIELGDCSRSSWHGRPMVSSSLS